MSEKGRDPMPRKPRQMRERAGRPRSHTDFKKAEGESP